MRESWLGCPGTAATERPVVDTAVVVIVAGNNISSVVNGLQSCL